MTKLRFTDGTTTVDVSNLTTGILTAYRPGVAEPDVPEVTDKAKVLLLGGLAAIRTTIRSLNRLFQQAIIWNKDRTGTRVYVERNLGDGVWWRSEITTASLLSMDKTLDTDLAGGKMEFDLIYSRKNYWDGAETQIPLSNSNGTNNTTGLVVWNHDDSGTGHDNYVEIAAGSVDGDLPGPTRLEITNLSPKLELCWIGHNWTDTTLGHILEAENASGGSTQASAAASNGSYKQVSLSSGAEATLLSWTLSDALISAAKGGWFKALVRFHSNANLWTTRFRLKIQWNGFTQWESEQVYPEASMATYIRDLFTFRLPPWLHGEDSLDGFTLVLTGQQSTGSTYNLQIDFLQLTPLDGWRSYLTTGYGCPENGRIVDDGIQNILYIDDGAGANKVGNLVGYGSPITVYPGKKQRLYFLTHGDVTSAANIDRQLRVKLFYRPRRLTI